MNPAIAAEYVFEGRSGILRCSPTHSESNHVRFFVERQRRIPRGVIHLPPCSRRSPCALRLSCVAHDTANRKPGARRAIADFERAERERIHLSTAARVLNFEREAAERERKEMQPRAKLEDNMDWLLGPDEWHPFPVRRGAG